MFDDHAGGLLKLFDAFQSRIGVGDIVEREFLALKLAGSCHTGISGVGLHIKCRFLVRVLAVTHFLCFDKLRVVRVGKRPSGVAGIACAKVVGDHAVVSGGVFKGGNHQFVAGLVAEVAIVGL